MMSIISRMILNIIGFKITGKIPYEIKKNVMVVVPHTSNWDFPLGLLVRSAIRYKISYVAKHTLFKPGIGWFFKALGGIPVNRTRSTNSVKVMANLFEETDKLAIVIAPEGTRKKVDTLKKGFYYISKQAGVPIIPIKFDYKNREINFGEPFYHTDDEQADLEYFDEYFKGVQGKVAENSYGYGK